MTYGLDTTFLIELDVVGHDRHASAVALRDRLLQESHTLAIAPQVLAEYIHVISDPRRFSRPASMDLAIRQSRRWWNATEVVRVFPTDEALALFHSLMIQRRFGRKRVLDSMLAATYRSAGVDAIVTSNARDYSGLFDTIHTT